jgi:hypothetical protein
MSGLKPSEEIIAATFGVTAVVGIFANMTPNNADVRADTENGSNNPSVHKSTRAAAITSGAIVSGIALLGKSPAVFVAGASTIVILSIAAWHANAVSGATGRPTTAVGE